MSSQGQSLREMTVKQLQGLLRSRNLPVSGRKHELIERLEMSRGRRREDKGRSEDEENHATKGENGLKNLTVKQIKTLLRRKGLPVTGCKKELLQRLENGSAKDGPKPKAWQHSDAKKDLKKALLNSSSPIHGMSTEEVQHSDDRYKQYPNFRKYYRDLKAQVEEEKKRIQEDDVAANNFIKSNPRKFLNQRGFPHWNTHAAKALLELDVAKKLHLKMKPNQLRDTNKAYKEFPPDVFAKRVNREVSKQNSAQFWAHKRNKKGMKKYLHELKERARA